MRIKFTFLEKEIIGVGVYRIMYETSVRMEEMPGFAKLKEQVEERVLQVLGTTLEEAKADSAYSMDFIVRKKPQLGVSLPGDNYTLVVTTSTSIKRIERSFTLQEDRI